MKVIFLSLFCMLFIGLSGCKAEFHPVTKMSFGTIAKNVIAQRLNNYQYLYLFEIDKHEYIGIDGGGIIHKVDCKCHSIMEK